MGIGSRIYNIEQKLKILFGLIAINHNAFINLDKSIYNKINRYFKSKYITAEDLDKMEVLIIKLSELNQILDTKLTKEQIEILDSCTTERFKNSNLQKIDYEGGYTVTPDPELINNPRFANLT